MFVAGAAAQEPQAPPTFRSGADIVRVDATVIDSKGDPVGSLTADDFEVIEDGRPQPIASFKFIAADGLPHDDRSLPIRSPAHASAEAARDEIRTFLIFWDEYHIEQFVSAQRGREGLQRAVLSAFGPTDLVGVMDPLTPLSAIEFTRDRRALADRIHRLVGRRGVYLPPRSAAEEEQLQRVQGRVERVEYFRNQVSVSAIKAAAAHLGALREARKSLIVVTEGFGALAPTGGSLMSEMIDESGAASDVVRTANASNTAIHFVDPGGLGVGRRRIGVTESIAAATGGEIHQTNDLVQAVGRVVSQASAVYLLGYLRRSPDDGRFHTVDVRVKRRGLAVRARKGYWAPGAADVEIARKRAAATAPAPVSKALAALTPANARPVADLWAAGFPLSATHGRMIVAWRPRDAPGAAAAPVALSVSATTATGTVFEARVDDAQVEFPAPVGAVGIEVSVLNREGEVLDSSSMTITIPDPAAAALALTTPLVYRARSAPELRQLQADGEMLPIHPGREFERTDRLLIRTAVIGASAAAARVTAALLDRQGVERARLPVRSAAAGAGVDVELPLNAIVPGEYLVRLEASGGAETAEALVPLRIVR